MKKRDKRFLNESLEEFGMVGWHVKTKEDRSWNGEIVDSELVIKDCNDTIALNFSCDKPHHIQKRIDKLDTLLESLNGLRETLVKAQEETSTRKFYY